MPLRVRCRCGQELIVKYSEWVYVFVALALFAALANAAAIVLVLVQLDRIAVEISAAAERPSATRTSAVETGDPSAGKGQPSASGKPAASVPENNGPETAEGASNEEGDPPERPVSGTSQPMPPPETASPAPSPDGAELAIRREGPPRPPPGSAVESLLGQLELRRAPEEAPTSPAAAGGPVVDQPALLRLLVLDELEDDPAAAAAFLLDPDPLIRLSAMAWWRDRLGSSPEAPAPLPPDAALLLALARPHLKGEEGGEAILSLLETSPNLAPRAGKAGGAVPKDLWERLEERASRTLDALPGTETLAVRLEGLAEGGVDILLVVDTTKSMERALADLKETAGWLLPAIEWGVPEVRVGLLLYKDEVEEIVPLSAEPSKVVLARLSAAQAAGGGDVPEGLYLALRRAMELGRVEWRTDAVKHIVIIGDQPPRYDEKRPFESLASASHRQGGFSIHALGVEPKDGLEEVPFFGDFARAGGGRHATATKETLGIEALACVLGEEHRQLIARLERPLERLFTSRE